MNPMTMPEFGKTTMLTNEDLTDSFIQLTPRQRQNTPTGDHQVGLYYICLLAHAPSSFSLLVQETTQPSQFQVIEPNFSYHFEMAAPEILRQTLILEMPRSTHPDDKAKFEFTLDGAAGMSLEFVVSYCDGH